MLISSLVAFLIGTGVAVLALLVILERRLEVPLRRLLGVMDEVGRGDLRREADDRGRDELAMLGSGFNRMVTSLRSTMDEATTVRMDLSDRAPALARVVSEQAETPSR